MVAKGVMANHHQQSICWQPPCPPAATALSFSAAVGEELFFRPQGPGHRPSQQMTNNIVPEKKWSFFVLNIWDPKTRFIVPFLARQPFLPKATTPRIRPKPFQSSGESASANRRIRYPFFSLFWIGILPTCPRMVRRILSPTKHLNPRIHRTARERPPFPSDPLFGGTRPRGDPSTALGGWARAVAPVRCRAVSSCGSPARGSTLSPQPPSRRRGGGICFGTQWGRVSVGKSSRRVPCDRWSAG